MTEHQYHNALDDPKRCDRTELQSIAYAVYRGGLFDVHHVADQLIAAVVVSDGAAIRAHHVVDLLVHHAFGIHQPLTIWAW
jgi:hypothetical protein